jgi:hypothetical protein
MSRTLPEIKNALDLLRLVFLYLTEGKSFSGTAALLHLAGMCSISKKAVFTRFQKCGEWLRWLCEKIYRNNETIGLFDLGMKEMAPTGTEEGEKVGNFKSFGEGDIVIGDRAYCSKQGIEYLAGRKSDFVLRFGTKRFHVYNRQGRKVTVPGYFKRLKPGESGEKTLYYEHEGEYQLLGFCGLRKTREAEEQGREALRKTRMRKPGDQELSKVQRAYNR